MVEKLKALETIARRLEPDASLRADVRGSVVEYAEDFLERIYQLPAYVLPDDKRNGIFDSPITDEPIGVDLAIQLLRENVDRPGLNPASGGHLGYIPGGGLYYSALGDYLADVMNRYAGIFYAGPGAVQMENMLLEWMAKLVGYPSETGGNLTSGGSIANLVGIVAAREANGLKAREIERSVIYLTSQAHHSVEKAIRIAGVGECILRYVPMDDHYRMHPGRLEETIAADKRAGLKPWLIIASAGTTDVGAVDPLGAIADVAQIHQLWLHVDGAYGGFFILCDEGKRILNGMDRSDSLVMDPHKGLFLPYGTGAILVKNRKSMHDAFWYQANYLQDALKETEHPSPADLSPELTKHFRGLRLWLPLKLFGLAPFRAGIEEKLLLARYFWEKLRECKGFEVGHYPDLSVVTYRYVPLKGDANAFNERLLKEIQRDGRVFLSSTMLNGKFTLRVAILAFRTHLDTVDLTLELLKHYAEKLKRSI